MRLVLLLSFLIGAQVHGQQVVVDPLADDPAQLRFDPGFIARNAIKTIRGEGLVKRDNQPMRDKNERMEYTFTETGVPLLARTSYTRKNGVHDTSAVSYLYDKEGRTVQEVRRDLTGAYALLDSLDTEKRCVRRTYARVDETASSDSASSRFTMISDERYSYVTLNDTATKRTWLNDQGLPYRERILSKDSYGYLRVIDDRYLITGRRGRITFRYSEKGRLYEREEQPDLSAPATTKQMWRYDMAGNVVSCDQFRNGKLMRHAEYLYEEGTMLLKAVIAKDEETGMIHVMRYTTERR